MARLHSLGYVGFTTPRVSDWPEFAGDIFGTETYPQPDGSLKIRWDDRAYRLHLLPGTEDRIAFIGWEMKDEPSLREMVAHLREHGVAVTEDSGDLARQRSVQHLATFTDPFGIPQELFTGQAYLDRTFRGTRATTGFITGAQGAGHIVIVVPSLSEAYAFYQDLLGFRVSDVVVQPFGTMSFLRLNPRHHNLALFEIPGHVGLNHIMIEAVDLNEVGKAYDLIQRSDHELASTLGRHTGDEQLSFYTRSPSGFDLELGCDSLTVDEETWTVRLYDKSLGSHNEVWGHQFQPLPPQSSVHEIPGGDPIPVESVPLDAVAG